MDISKLQGKNIGVFFGGQSPEHDVSIITGSLVIEELTKLGLLVEPVYIATDGAWCIGEELRDKAFLQKIHTQDLYPLQGWFLDTRHRSPKMILTKRPHFFTRRIQKTFDIVFPALHGPFGEDGTLQGLCEIIGVPYAGSPVLGCALAMDKALTKQLFVANDIATTPFVNFSRTDWDNSRQKHLDLITEQLTFPVFVKPTHGGSSIGITRVKEVSSLSDAIETALEFDTHVLVENGVSPMQDITCCVREHEDGTLQASLLQDSGFGSSDFFTYQEKYLQDGGAQLGAEDAMASLKIPADLPDADTKKMQELSKLIFAAAGLSGISRVDYLYNPETKQIYANEINPMPGTIYHHLWLKSGVETNEVVRDLLLISLKNQSARVKKGTYFESSILDMGGGSKGGKI